MKRWHGGREVAAGWRQWGSFVAEMFGLPAGPVRPPEAAAADRRATPVLRGSRQPGPEGGDPLVLRAAPRGQKLQNLLRSHGNHHLFLFLLGSWPTALSDLMLLQLILIQNFQWVIVNGVDRKKICSSLYFSEFGEASDWRRSVFFLSLTNL